MRRLVAAVALLLIGIGAVVSPAQAAKPAPVYSIALNEAVPALGDVVSFTVVGASSLRTPVVQVSCFQAGVKVWGSNIGPAESVKLGGDWSPWLLAGGPADCTAGLYDMPWRAGQQSSTFYAGTAFHAEG